MDRDHSFRLRLVNLVPATLYQVPQGFIGPIVWHTKEQACYLAYRLVQSDTLALLQCMFSHDAQQRLFDVPCSIYSDRK